MKMLRKMEGEMIGKLVYPYEGHSRDVDMALARGCEIGLIVAHRHDRSRLYVGPEYGILFGETVHWLYKEEFKVV